MKCNCNNCNSCLQHPDGLLCSKKMVFVEKEDTCLEWESDENFEAGKLVALAIIAIGVVIMLANFL